jgi:hypothetical protein
LSYLTPPGFDEGVERNERIVLGLGHPDLLQRPLGFRLLALRQFVEDVGGLVHPAARSLRQTLCLLLGRRHPCAGQARGRRAVPAGHHRRHAGGQEGACRLIDGVRESAQSWREMLLDLKRHGLSMGPELAVADGALGFWQAVEEVWPQTRGRRAAQSPTKSECARRLHQPDHARAGAHGHWTDAGHDLALGQVSVPHQSLTAVVDPPFAHKWRTEP